MAVSPKPVEDKNQAKVFGFEGTNVRVILDKHRSPWFVGADVCAILGYSDAYQAIHQHCKNPEKLQSVKTTDWKIPPKGMTIINRPDVFRLIMRSQLPAAERFESWVVEEVLPAIQDHGAYLTPQVVKDVLNDPDLIIGLATKLKQEQAQNAKLAAERARIAEEKAKVEFAKRKIEIEKARVVAVDSHALQLQALKFRVLGPRHDLGVVARENVQIWAGLAFAFLGAGKVSPAASITIDISLQYCLQIEIISEVHRLVYTPT